MRSMHRREQHAMAGAAADAAHEVAVQAALEKSRLLVELEEAHATLSAAAAAQPGSPAATLAEQLKVGGPAALQRCGKGSKALHSMHARLMGASKEGSFFACHDAIGDLPQVHAVRAALICAGVPCRTHTRPCMRWRWLRWKRSRWRRPRRLPWRTVMMSWRLSTPTVLTISSRCVTSCEK